MPHEPRHAARAATVALVRTRRHRVRSRRRWFAAAVAAVALVVAGYAAFRIATRESATPASVAASIGRFRALPAAARTLPPSLRDRAPEPGVYRYATGGFEVSHVFGARRHPYPPTTAVTVSAAAGGCVQTRWDVLASRWDALLACRRADGGWRLVSQSEEHAFAGHVDRRAYRCTTASTYLPPRPAPGAHWAASCAIPGTTTSDSVRVLGTRTLTLDGRRTRTLLLRTTTRVSGETIGVGTTFTWILPRSGLVVRRTFANASASATVVGTVRYEERATLALDSPRPRR